MPLSSRQLNFDRVYSPATTKRSYDNIDESSLSEDEEINDDRGMTMISIQLNESLFCNLDDDMLTEKTTNDIQCLLKRPRRKKKKPANERIRDGIFLLL